MSATIRSSRWAGFRSVLCPVDFSEYSRLALQHAEAVALRASAALTVVYANDPLLVAAAAAALHDRHIARRSAKEFRAFVDETLSAGTMKRLRVTCAVSIGDPRDEIVDIARRRRSGLIVMGTHGLTGTDRLLMGSTTLRILERTTIPVLAVPRTFQSGAGHALTEWPGRQIVAAIELDRDSNRDAAVATALAEWFGSSLLLLHVLRRLAAPAWMKGDSSAHDRIRVAEAEQRLDALADVAVRRVKTSAQVIWGDVADEIAALAAAERIGLVTTALRDKQGWLGSRRGSISYHVLTHAVTPVLAYPPTWQPR